jgi:hypothetical protein
MNPYDRVLAIAKTFLGPAAESFLTRQCKVALDIEAAKLTPSHFKDLAIWVEVSACRFIEQDKALEMARRIGAL